MTGRAAVLVLVVAVLAVSYASSMKAYVQQRAHINDLKGQIATSQRDIQVLEREKRRWEDPAFVQSQARERFGYVMPGETALVVLGVDGEPLDPASRLADPETVLARAEQPWFSTAWESTKLAGDPPRQLAPPPAVITVPKGSGGQGDGQGAGQGGQ